LRSSPISVSPIACPMSPTLNSDLLELVIKELGEGRPRERWALTEEASQTLKACVSASPVLRSAAQRQLFKIIYIMSMPRAKMLSEIIAGNPGLARNVLKFGAHPGSHRRGGEWLYTPSPFSLISFLSLFPCIEHIQLSGINFEQYFSDVETRVMFFRALPPSIVRVACSDCRFSGSSQLVALLHSFQSSLHTLSVVIPEWSDSADAEPGEVSQVKTISPHTLSVRSLWGSSDAIRPWFSVLSPTFLTNLSITIHVPADVPPWQAILDGAPKLRSLDISELVEHSTLLDLSSLTELRTLSADYGQMWDYFVAANNTDPTRAFCRILATARKSVRLERAELTFRHQTEELFALIVWPQVQEAIGSSAWADRQPNLVIVLSKNRARVDEEFLACVRQLEAAIEKHGIHRVTIKQDLYDERFG
jgi:hypothetical protein